MSGRIRTRLEELGVVLPQAAAPVANYSPYIKTGDLVYIAGQICVWNGELKFEGKLGREFNVEDGKRAARICTLKDLLGI